MKNRIGISHGNHWVKRKWESVMSFGAEIGRRKILAILTIICWQDKLPLPVNKLKGRKKFCFVLGFPSPCFHFDCSAQRCNLPFVKLPSTLIYPKCRRLRVAGKTTLEEWCSGVYENQLGIRPNGVRHFLKNMLANLL